jgi:hypothetical protein
MNRRLARQKGSEIMNNSHKKSQTPSRSNAPSAVTITVRLVANRPSRAVVEVLTRSTAAGTDRSFKAGKDL